MALIHDPIYLAQSNYHIRVKFITSILQSEGLHSWIDEANWPEVKLSYLNKLHNFKIELEEYYQRVVMLGGEGE